MNNLTTIASLPSAGGSRSALTKEVGEAKKPEKPQEPTFLDVIADRWAHWAEFLDGNDGGIGC